MRRRKFGPGPRKKTRITKIPFIKIKDEGTREQCWIRLAEYNWISANGPVPPGLYVVSKNGDATDCHLENLTLSNRTNHILLNKRNFPGMDARGAASCHIILKKQGPMFKTIYGPEICVWECSNCSANYEQNIMPETCDKCGHHSFEKSIYRGKTG